MRALCLFTSRNDANIPALRINLTIAFFINFQRLKQPTRFCVAIDAPSGDCEVHLSVLSTVNDNVCRWSYPDSWARQFQARSSERHWQLDLRNEVANAD